MTPPATQPTEATRVDLSRRATELRELMDDPHCDLARLERTYEEFMTVNRLVSGWRGIYRSRIRPLLAADRLTTLLDIGFGGGDVPRALARWAASDGLRLAITAIDPDERAGRFVGALPPVPGVTFLRASSDELVSAGRSFDLVTSNHLLHHLDDDALQQVLADSTALANRRVIHNDIERSRIAYAAYAPATLPFARGSFIHQDGLLSIRRSYRRDELAAVAPAGWRVERSLPFRLLLVHDSDGSAPADAEGSARA
ncbi:class I SAM-dependent methyltransferase [Plantibacter sp. YIM 135249]|uniref:class I SAM-dependent methyltransferase n=1 Tax=Plantibacter sp. YIM 135249 TaxID=3423918 RepID=UPI003D3537F5